MIPGWTAEQLRKLKQGDGPWLQARKGCVTASRVDEAICYLKNGKESAGRLNYKLQLVAERVGGWVADHYVSEAMRWGIDTEPLARAAYEDKFDVECDLIGIEAHPTIDYAMASPDALVGSDGLVEFKCPNTSTHVAYILAGILPKEYEPQVMWQLACTKRKWCDFVSFDARLQERHQIFQVRVIRDDKRIAEMEQGVRDFLAEVAGIVAELDKRNPQVQRSEIASTDDGLSLCFDDLPGDWRADIIAVQGEQ